MPISRRRFLQGSAASAAAWWTADALRAAERAWALVRSVAVRPELTTLASTFAPTGPDGAYRRLGEVPGFPFEVRTLGTDPKPGREDRRTALATVVHLTDIHLIDSESPARVEFLDRYADPPTNAIPFSSAYRPQETLTGQVADAMVQRVNAIGRGPVTGRAFDCAVSTGDSIDNSQVNELGWQVALLDGGATVTPGSGSPDYEGVMDQEETSYDAHYWHPDDERPDGDFLKVQHGFPAVPGLLAASMSPFEATGLRTRWFATYGNHDGLVQGNAPPTAALDAIATGPLKVVDLPAGMSPGDLASGLIVSDPAVIAALATAPARAVTPDPLRRFASAADWVEAHLASPATPGPVGHGMTEAHRDGRPLLFSFDVAPGVLGISIDTCARGGYADGNLYEGQVAEIEAMLRAATGKLVVLFSHHGLSTLDNPAPDPTKPGQARVPAAAFEALLHRYPQVVCWVSGHSHVNRVVPRPSPSGSGGFWEVLTAAHVDWPQQARIVELVDNADGTLSIFGTLVDHGGPAVPGGLVSVLDLAAWSRELSFNDPQANLAALGEPGDRNVELVLPHPFAAPAAAPAPSTTTGGTLPATGSDDRDRLVAAAALGAVGAATAVALRPQR